MIEQQGRVVGVARGKVSVRLGGSSGCARCDAGKGCGAGIFGRLLKRRPVVLEIDNEVDATEGQAVVVGIPEALFLRLIGRLYLLPILAGLSGAAVGHYLARSMALGAAAVDLVTLMAACALGAVAVLRNRAISTEFPQTNIVHLLRVIEFRKTGI